MADKGKEPAPEVTRRDALKLAAQAVKAAGSGKKGK